MTQVRWLPWIALCAVTAACSPSTTAPSGDVLARLKSSRHVDSADSATCRHLVPPAMVSGRPPTVLATDRASYREVAAAMRAHGLDQVLKLTPRLPASAVVTLCLVDTRGVPAAHGARVTYAVSGKSIWVADGAFDG